MMNRQFSRVGRVFTNALEEPKELLKNSDKISATANDLNVIEEL